MNSIASIGWYRVPGGKGSHEKYAKQGVARRLAVPFNLYSRHLANSILKDAGSSDRV